jgi:hypothetical protein
LWTSSSAIVALQDLLERHRAAFVIRVNVEHAKAAALSSPFFLMDEAQGDATHLLQECDAIIGDYSSVAIDALLFDRPLALWCEDIERYTSQRPLPYFDFRQVFGWGLKASLPELRSWIADRLQSRPLPQSELDGLARAPVSPSCPRRRWRAGARGGSREIGAPPVLGECASRLVATGHRNDDIGGARHADLGR